MFDTTCWVFVALDLMCVEGARYRLLRQLAGHGLKHRVTVSQ